MTYFTTGQLAAELRVSGSTIRALCQSGAIQASRSPGGHFRVSADEMARLKSLEYLPQVPHTATVGNGVRPAKGTQHQLLGEPSPEVIGAAEEAFVSDRELVTDKNRLDRLRVRKEGVELQDFFADREQRRLAREIEEERLVAEQEAEELRQRRAEITAERYQQFLAKWFGYAVEQKPRWDGPDDFPLVIQSEVLAALATVQPGQKDSVVQSVVDAAIARALQPWHAAKKKRETKRDAISRATSSLPLRMQWNDEWLVRVKEVASNAVDGAREDATAGELAAIAGAALHPLIREYQHDEKIQEALEALQFVSVPGADWQEQEEAKEVARKALAELPTGASDRQIQQVVQNALVPIHKMVAARVDKTHRDQILVGVESRLPWGLSAEEKKAALAEAAEAIADFPAGASTADMENAGNRIVDRYKAKARLIESGLGEVYPYAQWMVKEFRYEPRETARVVESRVKPKIEAALREELNGLEGQDRVIDRVHELMEELENCY